MNAQDMWIAQISDPHLRPSGLLYQDVLDTAAPLRTAIAQINALDPPPDVVLLTGDVVDEGAAAEYAVARDVLAALQPKLLVIPGNHDERLAFRTAFHDHAYLPQTGPLHYVIDDAGPVRVIALDVTVPDLHHGVVDDAALLWLEQVLGAEAERPSVVMMHQPPLVSGVPYLDEYRCFGGDRLAEVLRRFPAVERVLCGHVHRQMQMRFGGTLLCTAPSTATTIALQTQADAEPASFIEPPGFLLHHWRPDRGMVTHSIPIGTFPGPFAFA
ncbi:phosphodiesterase [Acidisoma cladoniae]|uniref:phosphodiesterase n=1 Tax=Acidisoma cladoniae TaxID=3040935 RepID=UPI00254CE645|nr:phosphodiesterase [Acidisoma sp. PAMC 29798]